jgi:AraC-like DNA-binding protein
MHALPYFTQAGMLKQKSSDWQGACFAYCNITESNIGLNDVKSASLAIETAEEMCKLAGDKLSYSVFMQSKGRYLGMNKAYDQALDCFKLSSITAREILNMNIVTDNLLAISELYQAKGSLAEAFNFYKLYTASKDSVHHSSIDQSIAEMKLLYENEENSNKQNGLIRSQLQTVFNRKYIIGNAILLILVLLVAVYFYLKLKGNYQPKGPALFTNRNRSGDPGGKYTVQYLPVIPDKASKPMLTKKIQGEIWQHLTELMEAEKLYLNNDLSLNELANKLNTNTTYLSKVINEISHQNFSSFLNHYRIKEACKLLLDPQSRNLTIEGIALSAGFNSKSAFNTAFKKRMKITPSEYLILQDQQVDILV